jgi:soluble lytic murein transglycosylase-like protein
MDVAVHFHSRSAALRRLCFYFFLIIAAGLLLLPGQRTGDRDSGVPDGSGETGLAVYHPVAPFERAPTRPDPAPIPSRPAVRVKVGFRSIIMQAGRRHGVESALIKAIIMAESGYNPRAVSSRGAAGLMQLMPATAVSMGVKDRFDPAHNIDGGVRYFKKMLVRFNGDIRLALAAYNAGARKVRRYNGIPPFKTTRTYIEKVFQYYERYKNLEDDASSAV